MAPSFISSKTTERRSARFIERHPSQVVRSPFFHRSNNVEARKEKRNPSFVGHTRTPLQVRNSGTDSQGNVTLPGTTAGLIGVCVFIGVGIALIVGWKVYFRRRKRRLANEDSSFSVTSRDKSNTGQVILLPATPSSPSPHWAPVKVSPWMSSQFPKRPPTARSKLSDASSVTYIDEKAGLRSNPFSSLYTPSYRDQYSPTGSPKSPLTSTGMTYHTSTSSSPQTRHRPLVDISPARTPMTALLPIGERSSVIDDEGSDHVIKDIKTSLVTQVIAKSVVVLQAFPKTLDDELDVVEGETLHLVQEYKDGWCLCERITSFEVVQGVVPLCCLKDAPEFPRIGPSSSPLKVVKPDLATKHVTQQKPHYLKRSASLGVREGTNILHGRAGSRDHHLNPRIIRIT